MTKKLLLVALLVATAIPPAITVAADKVGFDHIATTYTGTKDLTSCLRMAEMVCCHCYKPMPDGTRFYYGVREAGSCRSYGAYCEGYAKCF